MNARLLMILAAVAAIFLAYRSCPKDMNILHERHTELARKLSVTSEDDTITRAGKVRALNDYFMEDLSVHLNLKKHPEQKWVKRDQLSEAATGALHYLKDLSVEFRDIAIAVSEDQQTGASALTATATTSNSEEMEALELKLGWVKFNGVWKIQKIETVRPLK